MRFDDKIVFITGSGGGIGSEVAKRFFAAGAKVFLTDARVEPVQQIAAEISKERATAERLDVTSATEVQTAVENAVRLFGRIDVLVNCAGIIDVHPFDEISESTWDRVMDVNAKGTFLCCQAVARRMIKQGGGGKIVNIASSYGKMGMPLYLHYCASKFAVIGITKTLALELAKYHINVNAVCPADVETEMLLSEFKKHAIRRQIPESQVREEFTSAYPLGRLGTPSDVANAILFLASQEADHITGSEININGGMRY
jgi:NAD(P)-dependent dehydrogenase (short-subunit alcohol dehydrogenase family)